MPVLTVTPKQIEDLLIAVLQQDGSLNELEIAAASNRDATVPALHAFAFCTNANPALPNGTLYKPDVTLTLVTSLFDHDETVRSTWLSKLNDRLVTLAEDFLTNGSAWSDDAVERGPMLCGLSIKGTRETSADGQTGDMFFLSLGVIARSGGIAAFGAPG